MFINGKAIMVNRGTKALNNREKSNWLVHMLFIKQEYNQCLKFVDELLEDKSGDKSEYAIYLKALILRIKGSIHDSLELFKKCHLLNPNNIEYLKQFGRSLYLLGRHKQAIELFNECLELDAKDWETYFYKGLSYRYMRQFDDAIKVFTQSNQLYPNENTFLELGKVYQLVQNYQKALEVYEEGLNTYPENPELLTTIG
jgi:Bardet-Biedl syndrome 4 protein